MIRRIESRNGWTWTLVVAVFLACASLHAQVNEPPAPTAEPPVETVPPEAATQAEQPADTAEAPPAQGVTETAPLRKVILLPVEFTVYESSLGALEAVPDWTRDARANLTQAATNVLRTTANLELMDMPDLTAEEQLALRDHVGLARLIVSQGSALSGKVWARRRSDFDRSIGDGLRFLKERSGADYAILLDGMQVKQSGGSIFTQLALLGLGVISTGGGGTQLIASVIDLEAGEVKWFNSKLGVQVYGMGGSDVRKSDAAEAALRELFQPYPAIPSLSPGK